MKTKNKRIIIWRIISLIMLIATCIIGYIIFNKLQKKFAEEL
jgi:ABC-type polysaccharide/polyol phosphate export permease